MPRKNLSRIVAVIVATNIVLVLTASLIHFANAQEGSAVPTPTRVPPAEFSSSQADSDEKNEGTLPESTAEELTTSEPSPEVPVGEEFQNLEVPDSLPEAKLPDAATLKNDPVFAEFQKMFGGQGSASETSSTHITPRAAGEVDTETLIERLESANKLTQQAQRLALESQKLHTKGFEEQAKSLANLAQQISGVAAEVLTVEP